MGSEPSTATEFLSTLDEGRRAVLTPVHEVVHAAMPPGYAETVASGFINWSVPLARYPNTYNGQALSYVALTAQKRHCALYLMGLYSESDADAKFRADWRPPSGRPLNMGKSCLRFTRVADLDLDRIIEVVAATPVETFLAAYERIRGR